MRSEAAGRVFRVIISATDPKQLFGDGLPDGALRDDSTED